MVVRIIDAPADNPTLHPEACGVAYVLKETDRGWLATAFSDRIADAATRVGVDAGTLLGLVIAHELGHLLLGSGYHGWTGVMRADWPDELLDHNGTPLAFLDASKPPGCGRPPRSPSEQIRTFFRLHRQISSPSRTRAHVHAARSRSDARDPPRKRQF